MKLNVTNEGLDDNYPRYYVTNDEQSPKHPRDASVLARDNQVLQAVVPSVFTARAGRREEGTRVEIRDPLAHSRDRNYADIVRSVARSVVGSPARSVVRSRRTEKRKG